MGNLDLWKTSRLGPLKKNTLEWGVGVHIDREPTFLPPALKEKKGYEVAITKKAALCSGWITLKT
jgi:hypothetical protein